MLCVTIYRDSGEDGNHLLINVYLSCIVIKPSRISLSYEYGTPPTHGSDFSLFLKKIIKIRNMIMRLRDRFPELVSCNFNDMFPPHSTKKQQSICA